LQLLDLPERIAQFGRRHHFFASAHRRQAAVLMQFAPLKQLDRIDAVQPRHL